MKKLYEKSKIGFAVAWIVLYCLSASVGDSLSLSVGIEKSVTLPVLAVLSLAVFLFIKRNGLLYEYGICRSEVKAAEMLFYLPLALLLTANLWYGITFNLSAGETVLYVLSMLCVGFLEEIIFRGFLYKAMLRDTPKFAVPVSAITFGMGHIINLVNGSGAELLPNLLQVVYAVAAGFMFVMIYRRSKSLIVCIAAHGIFNSLSAFANETMLTDKERVISCTLITVISGGYAVFLAVSERKILRG